MNEKLESIPGRARIVDAEGNPIDPHDRDAIVPPEPEPEPEPDPDPEPPDEPEEGHHARSVRRRHSRAS
jgi:hypothetical protein